MNGVLEDVSDKVSLSCFYVAWESYQYENILSLVVSCGWDADVNEYNVYLYDIVSGQQLTTAGLLKALDVDETVFLEAVKVPGAGFGVDTNVVTLITESISTALPLQSSTHSMEQLRAVIRMSS